MKIDLTTLHINAFLFGIMLTGLQVILVFLFTDRIWLTLVSDAEGVGELDVLITGAFFTPVYALSQVVKRFAGINGNGHPKKENVPYD